ncbi:MAG: DNA-formamidopyrimidine glycosylase family protein [Planctomycetota bacterium]
MPEGDTLHRIAEQLRPVLAGHVVESARASRPRSGAAINAGLLVGKRVDAVEAVGKHLLVTFSGDPGGGCVLHSHLGMTGAWHAYERNTPWRKPAKQAAIILVTATHTVINFSPKRLELTTGARLRGDTHFARLGPDLMLPGTTADAILPRLRTSNGAPIGEAVMNQTIAAGIGNVYKSESLFLAKLDPWRPVGEIDDQALLAYLTLTQKLMLRNRGGGMRTTRFAASGPRLWVYGRRGEPCLVCGGVIHLRRQGDQGRSTYWCPACQPPTAPTADGP